MDDDDVQGIELAAIMTTTDGRVLGFRRIEDARLPDRRDWLEIWTAAGWLRRCHGERNRPPRGPGDWSPPC